VDLNCRGTAGTVLKGKGPLRPRRRGPGRRKREAVGEPEKHRINLHTRLHTNLHTRPKEKKTEQSYIWRERKQRPFHTLFPGQTGSKIKLTIHK